MDADMARVIGLEGRVPGAGDDLVLEREAQVAEVVAVTGHADDQIAVLLRMALGVPQSG